MFSILNTRFGQGLYKYKKSQKGKALFKIRVYSVIIYYLLKSINIRDEISLDLCKDFDGREEEIKNNLKFLLGNVLKLKLNGIRFIKLERDSNAHTYAYLMRKDKNNKLKTYENISLDEIEKYLKK